MSAIHVPHRVGGWLPRNQAVLDKWLAKKLAELEADEASRDTKTWYPVIQEFKRFIEEDPVVYMGFHEMFEQVPHKPPYNKDPTGKCQVRNYMWMLALFNKIIRQAPDYEQNDLVGFPINAILDWPMGTDAGFRTFIDPKVNAHFKAMFDDWTVYLQSEASRSVLTTDDNGWFGPAASEAIPDFADTYVCDPSAPYYGFTSWDDFFTRLFRDGKREVQFKDNDSVINSACESTVRYIKTNVKAKDKFWLKGQPYSLDHMFNNDQLTPQFVGGTVYQAFLSATKYHRWHSPVNGVIVKTINVPGTYYAESPRTGFEDPDGPDHAGPDESQAFITSIAARALIFIQADNPNIGLMCFVAVGMAEVSTCQVTVNSGQRVKKGDQIGMFHFGGSTHCLVFRPETKVVFDVAVDDDVLLNQGIATVQ